MPDITMCTGGNCPLKESCYRFTATPNKYWQSYFVEPPVEVKAWEDSKNDSENKNDPGAPGTITCDFYDPI